MGLVTVLLKDPIGTLCSIEPVGNLLYKCRNITNLEDFLLCVRCYLADRHIRFIPGLTVSSSVHRPQIMLVNHSYELAMVQSYLNLSVLRHLSPLVLVCEASYRTMAPPPLSNILDRILTGHIRIDRSWDRTKRAHVLYTGMLSALRRGQTVVLYGDVDTLTQRNPLRQLYRTVLDRLLTIPKRVFHIWPYVVPYPFEHFDIPYTYSPILWTTTDIVAYRKQIDERWL
jgi:hypothetical protein